MTRFVSFRQTLLLAVAMFAAMFAFSGKAHAQGTTVRAVPYYVDYKSKPWSLRDNTFMGTGDFELKFKVPVRPKSSVAWTWPSSAVTNARRTFDRSWFRLIETKDGYHHYQLTAGSGAREAGGYGGSDEAACRFANELGIRYYYK
jgi:hypothetical protein